MLGIPLTKPALPCIRNLVFLFMVVFILMSGFATYHFSSVKTIAVRPVLIEHLGGYERGR